MPASVYSTRSDAPSSSSRTTAHRPRRLTKPRPGSLSSSAASFSEAAAMWRDGRGAARGDPAPPSPTSSAGTSTTAFRAAWGAEDAPTVICTRSDLRASTAAYEGLLAAAKQYRNATVALSSASIEMAGALEQCARVKGAFASGEQLMAASGVHYMIANSGQVLGDMLYRSFEIPLMHAYDAYVVTSSNRHAEYEQLLAERTEAIRRTEAENIRQGRNKSRDLQQFRRALERLQEQVREVEAVKRSYYNEVLEHETETWSMIGSKVSLVIRSTLDLADRLASKSTADPTIESMLNEHPDPFDAFRKEGDEESKGDVFTVLPPLGMNLGLGGSKKGSIIDLDKEESRALEIFESNASEGTPRASGQSREGLSPGDILGISDGPAVHGPSEVEDIDSPDDTPRRRIGSEADQPTSDITTVADGSGVDEDKTERHNNPFETDSLAPDSPTPVRNPRSAVREEAYLSSPLNPRSPRKSKNQQLGSASSGTSNGNGDGETVAGSGVAPTRGKPRRRKSLSRVTEVESDPMAGDWSTDEVSRTFDIGSGAGYDSGEDGGP